MKVIITYLVFILPMLAFSQTVAFRTNGAGGNSISNNGISFAATVGSFSALSVQVSQSNKPEIFSNATDFKKIEANLLLSEMVAFPNPTTNILFISFPEKIEVESYQIWVADMLGRAMPVDKRIEANNIVFDFLNVSAGIYTITLFNKSNDYTKVFKVQVEKDK